MTLYAGAARYKREAGHKPLRQHTSHHVAKRVQTPKQERRSDTGTGAKTPTPERREDRSWTQTTSATHNPQTPKQEQHLDTHAGAMWRPPCRSSVQTPTPERREDTHTHKGNDTLNRALHDVMTHACWTSRCTMAWKIFTSGRRPSRRKYGWAYAIAALWLRSVPTKNFDHAGCDVSRANPPTKKQGTSKKPSHQGLAFQECCATAASMAW